MVRVDSLLKGRASDLFLHGTRPDRVRGNWDSVPGLATAPREVVGDREIKRAWRALAPSEQARLLVRRVPIDINGVTLHVK